MNSIRSFKSFLALQEELNTAQKMRVQSWLPKDEPLIRSEEAERLSGHVIPPGQQHIVIPATPTVMNRVREHLQNNGHDIHDYAAGLAKDKYNRTLNIGRALSKTKAPQELIDSYASDDRKSAVDMDKHEIVISRHPYHVAEGSTGKSWKSCAGLTATGLPCRYGGGAAARKLPDEIQQGTHVAYLISKNKPGKELSIQERIDKAKARVYLKPHESQQSGHKVIVPENAIYSETQGSGKNQGFLDSVKEFTNKNFPMKPGELYYKNKKVYDDDSSSQEPKFNVSDESINKIMSVDDPSVRSALRRNPNLSAEHLHKLIDHYDHPILVREALLQLSTNPSLNNDHIDKLLNKNIPGVNATLGRHKNLSEKHIDRLLNSEYNDYTPLMINNLNSAHNNTSKFSSKHLHKMLDIIKDFKDNPSQIKGNTEAYLDSILESIPYHKNLEHSHIDKIINNFDDPYTHTNLVTDFPEKLTDEHLQTLIDKWKNYDRPWASPADPAQNELAKRIKDRKLTDNLYAGLQEYNK